MSESYHKYKNTKYYFPCFRILKHYFVLAINKAFTDWTNSYLTRRLIVKQAT